MVSVKRVFGTVASVAGALLMATTSVQAGGFAVREQSSSGLGSAFAGVAAGGDLSSIYWNPAALSAVPGTSFESHYALIIPESELTASRADSFSPAVDGDPPVDLLEVVEFPNTSGNIGSLAVVPSTYGGYQLNSQLSIGIGLTSPFGLVTKPNNQEWVGAELARTAKIFTINLNPVVSYKVTDKIAIGLGPQLEYMDAKLRFATLAPDNPSTRFKGDTDGVDLGFTAGVLLTPMPGTSIGIGFRSSVDHELRGKFRTEAGVRVSTDPDVFLNNGFSVAAKATIETPELVTISLRQEINPSLRAMATFEWANWSRFETLEVVATGDGTSIGDGVVAAGDSLATLQPNWEDGWFLSFGLEHDYNDKLTVRGGVAYEESPVQDPDQRLFAVPDSNRIWLSAGATYKVSDRTTIDLAYTHIFVEDSRADQITISTLTSVDADVDARVDIIAVSLKRKLGGSGPEPLK